MSERDAIYCATGADSELRDIDSQSQFMKAAEVHRSCSTNSICSDTNTSTSSGTSDYSALPRPALRRSNQDLIREELRRTVPNTYRICQMRTETRSSSLQQSPSESLSSSQHLSPQQSTISGPASPSPQLSPDPEPAEQEEQEAGTGDSHKAEPTDERMDDGRRRHPYLTCLGFTALEKHTDWRLCKGPIDGTLRVLCLHCHFRLYLERTFLNGYNIGWTTGARAVAAAQANQGEI